MSRCEIKALAGNSATCLGFCFRLEAGSIAAASHGGTEAWHLGVPEMGVGRVAAYRELLAQRASGGLEVG